MTTPRDIEIVQGQTWTELFIVDGLVSTGNGLRMHIRDHHGATLLRAALAHDNAANERISFTTGGMLANLGASISTGWDLQGQPVRRWVYSIERYSLTDVDDVTVHFTGTAIVKSNPTDESSITKVAPHPSYDEACLRFDVEQTLTEPQRVRVRANAGFPDGGALVSWGGIGGTLSDQTDLVSALAAKSGTGHTHTGTYEPAGAVSTHAEASDPHPGYLRNLAIDGTAALLATVSSDGESLGRSAHTTATLIAAAAAAAPVQSVAGRTGAVVIAVGDVSGAEASANKAQANGYASLDSGGKVPQAQIPAIAITEYLGDVASQAAMLALSGQKGDWCTRSDSGATWIITGTDPTLLGSWTSVTYPASPVTSVAGRTGAVTLSTSDVSGLGTAATLNVPASGNAASGEVVKGSDTRLSDSRAPTSHTHPLSELTQSSATSGQVVTWNGSAWVPATPSGGGLTKFTEAESTSSPNATVYVDSLSANGASTNVDFACVPKGTGAFLLDIPDGTTTGGNKRGPSSVDLQMLRSTAAQVASGTAAFQWGGYCTASGNYATAGGYGAVASGTASAAFCGYEPVASGSYSLAACGSRPVASGFSSSAFGEAADTRNINGAHARASGSRAASGDRQRLDLMLAKTSTSATPVVLTQDAGAATALNMLTLPNNSTMFFEIDVVAHDTALKSATWKIQGTIRRGANAAATAIVGTNVTTAFGSDLVGAPTTAPTVTANTTLGAIEVTFTGIAATTIYTNAYVRTQIAA